TTAHLKIRMRKQKTKRQRRVNVHKQLRQKYGAMALQTSGGENASCTAVTTNLYRVEELVNIPTTAVKASLGSGNPLSLTELHDGQTVLDLGSGGGLDVLLSARRVGPTGKAY